MLFPLQLSEIIKVAKVSDWRDFSDMSGLYSWNLPIPFDINDEEALLRYPRINEKIARALSGEQGIGGRRYDIDVHRKEYVGSVPSVPEAFKSIRNLVPMFKAITLFTAPLYIGKAVRDSDKSIGARIREEERSKAIGGRITSAIQRTGLAHQINVSDFTIVALDVQKLLEQLSSHPLTIADVDDAAKYIESLLFWGHFPPLNTKKGS